MDRPPPYSSATHAGEGPLKLPPVQAADGSTNRSSPFEPLPSLAQSLALPKVNYENATRSAPGSAISPPSGTAPRPLNLPPVLPKDHSVSTSTDAVSSLSMEETASKRDASVSMDDPDDRMAAEALCGLGKVDSNRSSVRSPSGYETPLQYYPIDFDHTTRSGSSNEEPEPLLSLLTSSHPWLGGTINSSISAYSSTKSNSPSFIQYSANFVERKIGSPMASTVGSVGRKTGVEGSLRRYLGSRRASELDRIDPEILAQQGTANKRRRISDENEDMDVEDRGVRRTLSGHASIDTLPVYDDNRSPAYEDSETELQRRQQQQLQQLAASASNNATSTAATTTRPPVSRSWSSQLMISTSGLGAALNEPSLRSLKYCLSIIRGANAHVRTSMDALKKLLSDYDRAAQHRSSNSPEQKLEAGAMQLDGAPSADGAQTDDQTAQHTLANRIQQLNTEIWQTLKSVVDCVSRYTGGALPENASVVVRWQLMSVPRRWKRAVSNSHASGPNASNSDTGVATGSSPLTGTEKESSPELEAVGNAHRMLAFAIEGIDMMEQVGGVVDSTISSAEKWLDSLGRRKSKQTEDTKQGGVENPGADIKTAPDAPADVPMEGQDVAAQEEQPQDDRKSEDTAMDTAT